MIPTEVKGKYENEKHNYTTVADLRAFFSRVIEDHKASGPKKLKPKGIHELMAEALESRGEEPELGE